MESNGNTLRMRKKAVRGPKSEDSAILAGLQVCRNHVGPHLALGGRTPGEAAGIHVDGSKLLTLAEAAAKFAARIAANPLG